MKLFERPAALALFCLGVCALIGAAFWWLRQSEGLSPSEQARYFPDANGSTVSIDVAALRRLGVLEALGTSTVGVEEDYRSFVRETRFDYTKDLDRVLGVIGEGHAYFLLSGRFQWAALRDYAKANQGNCDPASCRVPASRPGEWISYELLKPSFLSLVVSKDPQGVRALDTAHPSPAFVPDTALAAIHLSSREVAQYANAPTKYAPLLQALGPVQSAAITLDRELTAKLSWDNSGTASKLEEPLRILAKQLNEGITKRDGATITITWKLDLAAILKLLAAGPK